MSDINLDIAKCTLEELQNRFHGRSINPTAIQQLRGLRKTLELGITYRLPIIQWQSKYNYINSELSYFFQHIYDGNAVTKRVTLADEDYRTVGDTIKFKGNTTEYEILAMKSVDVGNYWTDYDMVLKPIQGQKEVK